jgi:hypothetical protein
MGIANLEREARRGIKAYEKYLEWRRIVIQPHIDHFEAEMRLLREERKRLAKAKK